MHTLDFTRIPPWERMRSLVAAHLGAHPVLRGLEPGAVQASRFGVRVRCAGETVEVARFEWYLPLSDERARILADALAARAGERLGTVAA